MGISRLSAEDIALICSHEIGHNLGLNHDGSGSLEYYDGHGGYYLSSNNGAAFDKNVRHGVKGEYYFG